METLFSAGEWKLLLVGPALLLAALLDHARGKIPNVLTVPLALAGLLFNFLLQGADGLLLASSGFALGFALLLLPFLLQGSGAGDLKLLAALGACLGPAGVFAVFCLSLCAAALYAGIRWLATRGTPRWSTSGMATEKAQVRSLAPAGEPVALHKRHRVRGLPYAIPLALAGWFYLLSKLLVA